MIRARSLAVIAASVSLAGLLFGAACGGSERAGSDLDASPEASPGTCGGHRFVCCYGRTPAGIAPECIDGQPRCAKGEVLADVCEGAPDASPARDAGHDADATPDAADADLDAADGGDA